MKRSPQSFTLYLVLFTGLLVGCGLPEEQISTVPKASSSSAISPPTSTTLPTAQSLRKQLAIVQTSLSDRIPQPGQQITATSVVQNLGSLTSQTTRLRYYISKYSTFGRGETYLNYVRIPALQAQARYELKTNLRIPEGLGEGEYYMWLLIDESAEATLRDGSTLKSLKLTVRLIAPTPEPVLATREGIDWSILQAHTHLEVVRQGQMITARSTIANLGKEAAPAGRVRYYLSKDQKYDSTDRYLNYDNLPPLASGQRSEEEANMHIPQDLPPGKYYLLVVIDPMNQAHESDESNNVAAIEIEVQ